MYFDWILFLKYLSDCSGLYVVGIQFEPENMKNLEKYSCKFKKKKHIHKNKKERSKYKKICVRVFSFASQTKNITICFELIIMKKTHIVW